VTAWNHLIQHREDIIWAAIFALIFGLIFGVIVDIVGIGSRFREAIRELKNRMSERSTTLLTLRIQQLKDYQKKLTSERWIYLFAFQSIFLCLISVSLGASIGGFSWLIAAAQSPLPLAKTIIFNMRFAAIVCFGVSGGAALAGYQHVARDTREKVEAVVQKIDAEIEGLQEQLRKRSSPS